MSQISIVTICFNNLEEMVSTCLSVDRQEWLPYEHIIIDGSTNHDISNYLENNPQPSYRKWLCERDKGIADAFNKGIKRTSGDIILLLNSGDQLYDGSVLRRVAELFLSKPDIKWCHGKQNLFRGGLWVFIGKPFDRSKLYRGMRSVFHQTMYVKKELYDKYGLYDPSIKIAMDYDFVCRIANEPFAFIDYPLATFDPAGVSNKRYIEGMKEGFARYRHYYGWSLKQQLWGLRLRILYFLLKGPLGTFLYKLKVLLGKENM